MDSMTELSTHLQHCSVCDRLCSSGFRYARSFRTKPSYLALILLLRLVPRQEVTGEVRVLNIANRYARPNGY